MKVGVQLLGLDQQTMGAVVAHVNENWKPDEVVVMPENQSGSGQHGLLIVGRRPLPIPGEMPITDVVEVSDGPGGVRLDDLLFQLDAKLGRLTKSYLARQSLRSFLSRDAKVSRRELLMGARGTFEGHSNTPEVFADVCETKYGCSRCVAVCPANALARSENAILVNDTACTKCGLCAAACPVGAIQMPEFSEAAFRGLLSAIDGATAPRKTLVVTCDSEALERKPWMVVEEVTSVGLFGPRQMMMAAASSLGCVAVVCPDGQCAGRDSAKRAARAVSGVLRADSSPPLVVYEEGVDAMSNLADLHESSKARVPLVRGTGDRWKDYVSALESLSAEGGSCAGLGLTGLRISETCTLCGACVPSCPHGSLHANRDSLSFNATVCTGCGACVQVCPEHAITIPAATGELFQALKDTKVYEDVMIKCERCGTPIGSAKFVSRIASLLGSDNEHLRLCSKCKQRAVFNSLIGGTKHR